AAEVEAQGGQAGMLEGAGRPEHDLEVHDPAVARVGVADHGRSHGRFVGPHEDALEPARGPGDVERLVLPHGPGLSRIRDDAREMVGAGADRRDERWTGGLVDWWTGTRTVRTGGPVLGGPANGARVAPGPGSRGDPREIRSWVMRSSRVAGCALAVWAG